MTAVSESFILSRLYAFFHCLFLLYTQSAIGQAIEKLAKKIKPLVLNSAIFQFCAREGALTRAFPESRTYWVADRILNVGVTVGRNLYEKKAVRDSFFVRVCIQLGKRVWLCLAILYFILLITPHAAWNNLYGFLGIFLLTILFFCGCMPSKRKDRRLETYQFGVYFVLYAVILLFGLIFSYHFGLSIRFFLFHMTCLLTVLLMISSIRSTAQLKLLIGIILVGVTICSLYGCFQGVVGVEISAAQVDYSLELNAGVPGRIYSFFDNPNNFAEILVTLMPFYWAFLLMVKGWQKKLIVFIAMIPSIVAILMTYFRSGWIGLALAVIIFFAFQNWRLIPICIIVGIAAIPLLPQSIVNRILTIGNTQDSSTMYRFQIYDTIWPMFKDHWATGVGLGSDTVKEVIMTYPTKLSNQAYPIHSHNTYLQLWLECGIFGLFAFLGGTLFQFKEGIRKIFHPNCSTTLKYIMSAGIAGLCGVMVIALAEYTWFYPRVMFLLWFSLGILMTGIHLSSNEVAESVAGTKDQHTNYDVDQEDIHAAWEESQDMEQDGQTMPEESQNEMKVETSFTHHYIAESEFEWELEEILRSDSGFEPDEFQYLEPGSQEDE